jgi:hypothetical protein
MTIAYDIPSPVSVGPKLAPPCQEELWDAETSDEWSNASARYHQAPPLSVYQIIHQLSDDEVHLPLSIGTFGCHVVILTILRGILGFRKSCLSIKQDTGAMQRSFITTLRRWQQMWESEPQSILSPNDPRGPILFNSTAILRVAYIRLVVDFSPVRQIFSFSDSLEAIVAAITRMEPPPREWQSTRAALQSCLALRVPAQLGLKLVARTSFWIWSVQHALCYFECALLLAKWLQLMQTITELSNDEQAVVNLSQEVLSSTRSGVATFDLKSLPSDILRTWAHLLDTADATVWPILPKMANVLQLYADQITSNSFSPHGKTPNLDII